VVRLESGVGCEGERRKEDKGSKSVKADCYFTFGGPQVTRWQRGHVRNPVKKKKGLNFKCP
jgi:hypothetical protein